MSTMESIGHLLLDNYDLLV